jgi:hypothetical protein
MKTDAPAGPYQQTSFYCRLAATPDALGKHALHNSISCSDWLRRDLNDERPQ